MKLLPGLAALALAAPVLLTVQPAAAGTTADCPQHPITVLPNCTNWSLDAMSPDGGYQVGSAQTAKGVTPRPVVWDATTNQPRVSRRRVGASAPTV